MTTDNDIRTRDALLVEADQLSAGPMTEADKDRFDEIKVRIDQLTARVHRIRAAEAVPDKVARGEVYLDRGASFDAPQVQRKRDAYEDANELSIASEPEAK